MKFAVETDNIDMLEWFAARGLFPDQQRMSLLPELVI